MGNGGRVVGLQKNSWIGFVLAIGVALTACADEAAGDPAPAPSEEESTKGEGESSARTALDEDPDHAADPNAASPEPDGIVTASTEADLIKRFAPYLNLHPADKQKPANVDWYLSRVTMRFNHDNCPDHEILELGQVNQQSLVAQEHEDNKSLCRHDGSKKVTAQNSDHFFLEIVDHATYDGAPRSEWKTYVVRTPRQEQDGLVEYQYWAFYPFNDNLAKFNHESDWEHLRVLVDPKGDGGKGSLKAVRFSQHNSGEVLQAGDPKLEIADGTHPVSYVAKGSHANYPKPGTYDIEGTGGVAKDEAKPAASPADVWKTESTVLEIGTRAHPKNGQVFVKYWGRWGEIGELDFTSGVTRHFP